MTEELVSIVIPIYNTEKYLNRCVESVVNQTYQNLEIILVDDGSMDGCPGMCDSWARKDPRVKVIHKQNAGLGMARNTGIENATGEYICFFDSDDYIREETVACSVAYARKYNSDIVVFGFCRIDRDGHPISETVPTPPKDTFYGNEILDIFLPSVISPEAYCRRYNIWLSACMCMCRMDMITRSGWRFVSEREIISEDLYSLLDLYGYAGSVSVVPESLYCYCENMASLTKTYRKDRYEKIKIFYEACTALCKEKGYPKSVWIHLSSPYISFTIAALKQIAEQDMCHREKYAECLIILKDHHLHKVLSDINLPGEKLTRKVFLKAIQWKLYPAVYAFLVYKNRRMS